MFRNHQNKSEKTAENDQNPTETTQNVDDSAANHQNTKITVEELLEKVGVCHRLGYGSGCNCLNECFIIRQHLDTKTY